MWVVGNRGRSGGTWRWVFIINMKHIRILVQGVIDGRVLLIIAIVIGLVIDIVVLLMEWVVEVLRVKAYLIDWLAQWQAVIIILEAAAEFIVFTEFFGGFFQLVQFIILLELMRKVNFSFIISYNYDSF